MVLCVLRESRAFLPSFTTSKKKKAKCKSKARNYQALGA